MNSALPRRRFARITLFDMNSKIKNEQVIRDGTMNLHQMKAAPLGPVNVSAALLAWLERCIQTRSYVLDSL